MDKMILKKDLKLIINLMVLFILWIGFSACKDEPGVETPTPSILNLDHLDNLGEVISYGGQDLRIIHIYANAPDYLWVGDDDEGDACVDDAARAAVVYLRHFELSGDLDSAEKAKQLLRFILYMQTDEGLFHNFVWDNTLQKNTIHQNSVANEMNWWAGRAVWALGSGARILAENDSSFANQLLLALDKAMPHVEEVLSTYPATKTINGYQMPTWLIAEHASDASSELLLGLVAAAAVSDNERYDSAIAKLSEGISMMQYGNLKEAPYGAHISYAGGWHAWGNSQTMALAESGNLESAIWEADNFYPWLLVNGWLHSFQLENPNNRRNYEQIAYGVRAMSVGLIRLYEATDNKDYAIMAGLAASWFTGNNIANTKMYNSLYGYGYDGINGPNQVNKNSGAESTIEADFTILEVEAQALSNKWMYATSGEPIDKEKNGEWYRYKLFTVTDKNVEESIALVLNRSSAVFELMNQDELNTLLN